MKKPPDGEQEAKLAASCLILAGGQGTRLTPDKPLLQIAGRPIVERTAQVALSLFPEVILVTNSPEKYEFLGLPLVADLRRGCGPLMGIYSGLQKISQEAAFVCAADMPFLDPEMIRLQFRELADYDIVVPSPGSRPEFLHAFYRRRCLPALRAVLDENIFKIQFITHHCRTLTLGRDWFVRHGLERRMEAAFANVNTLADYERCLQREDQWREEEPVVAPPLEATGQGDPLQSLDPGVLRRLRQTLIEQETTYQRKWQGNAALTSLWAHCSRVGLIAHHIASQEGLELEPALLAGLFHDTGKFAHGAYHEDDEPEEDKALEFVETILGGSLYAKWIPLVGQAIHTMYLEDARTSELGRVVFDADNLDKLGCLGVGQFFAKSALRRRFLDEDLIVRASVEMTYAFHAPDTLKTATGRALAATRARRTLDFYRHLVQEWAQMGLGLFDILEEDIGGIACLMAVPRACHCGGAWQRESDIQDAVKCRSVVVKLQCAQCGDDNRFSFCLPRVKGLPPRENA